VSSHLRLVPKPIAKCPPEHLPEMRKAIAGKLGELACDVVILAQGVAELSDGELAYDLSAIVARLKRHRARLLEGT
jgi:hypothetical protein